MREADPLDAVSSRVPFPGYSVPGHRKRSGTGCRPQMNSGPGRTFVSRFPAGPTAGAERRSAGRPPRDFLQEKALSGPAEIARCRDAWKNVKKERAGSWFGTRSENCVRIIREWAGERKPLREKRAGRRKPFLWVIPAHAGIQRRCRSCRGSGFYVEFLNKRSVFVWNERSVSYVLTSRLKDGK